MAIVISLISFIGFGADDLGCSVGKPLVSPLHHGVDFFWFAKVTKLDTREIGSKYENIVEFYVPMTNFPAVVKRERKARKAKNDNQAKVLVANCYWLHYFKCMYSRAAAICLATRFEWSSPMPLSETFDVKSPARMNWKGKGSKKTEFPLNFEYIVDYRAELYLKARILVWKHKIRMSQKPHHRSKRCFYERSSIIPDEILDRNPEWTRRALAGLKTFSIFENHSSLSAIEIVAIKRFVRVYVLRTNL